MEIADLLRSRGIPAKKQGRTWGSSYCPICGQSDRHSNKLCLFIGHDGRERWYCHACGQRGDEADLLAALEGISLRDALRRVKAPATPAAPAPMPQRAAPPIEEVREVHLELLRALPMWEAVPAQYLMRRGIGRDTIMEAAARGLLRMLPDDPPAARDLLLRAAGGAKRLADAGLWAGRSPTWPAQSFRPLVFFAGNTSSEWRLIEADGQYPKAIRLGVLTRPMAWRADTAEVIVVEGPIDLLSLVEMGEKRTIIAIPGVNAWRIEWFVAAHQAYGSRFVIALDNDEAGNRMAANMMSALQERGIDCERIVPVRGKDWNEMLMAA
jgi:DNA primase